MVPIGKQPDANDWYETVKINLGVNQMGLWFWHPARKFDTKDYKEPSILFGLDKDVPSSLEKVLKILALYWLQWVWMVFVLIWLEIVPVGVLSFIMNSSIKIWKNPDAFLLAGSYDNPALYSESISTKGKMDILYDKVECYDQ